MSTPTLHPLLRYYQHNFAPDSTPACTSAMFWDLRQSPTYARHTTDNQLPLSSSDLFQFATTPPTTILYVTCGIFPNDWPMKVQNPGGITVRDVLEAIYAALQVQLRHAEWDSLSVKHQDRVNRIFDARWRVSVQPAESRAHGVLRIDCLLRHTWFAGLSCGLGTGNNYILSLRRPH